MNYLSLIPVLPWDFIVTTSIAGFRDSHSEEKYEKLDQRMENIKQLIGSIEQQIEQRLAMQLAQEYIWYGK